MKISEIHVSELHPASWNSNVMDEAMLARLRRSIKLFGFLEPLVVRKALEQPGYEVIGGSHRLAVLRESGVELIPCVVVEADEAEANLLSQALNHIEGEDDPVKRGASLKQILEKFSTDEVVSLLPESAKTISQLTTLGTGSPEEYFESWNLRKKARLQARTFQLTSDQLSVVDQALSLADDEQVEDEGNPNERSNALVHICREFTRSRSPL